MIAAHSIDAVMGRGTEKQSTNAAPKPTFRRQQTAGDILLTHAYYINLTRNEKRLMRPYAPLGLLSLAAYLRQEGYRVRVFDTTFQKGIGSFTQYIERHRPPLVAISVCETTRCNAAAMLRACNRCGIPVVVGGPDVSSDPALYLNCGASVAVVGEGEETMAELLGDFAAWNPAENRGSRAGGARRIDGVFRAGGRFISRRPIENLDLLPFPARDSIDYPAYLGAWKKRHGVTSMQIIASRGCPVFGAPYRLRSARSVAEEMLFLKMIYGPDRLWFADDVFGGDAAWVSEFRQEVTCLRARMPFECSCRADLVDDGVLRQLKEAGCFRIWYGVASGSPAMLGRMGMQFGIADVSRACLLTKKAGIEAGYYLELGYPDEGVEDVELTRKLIRQTQPDHCRVTMAHPHKGTALYRAVEKRLLPVWYADRMEDDRILTFKSAFSQNFYDMARRLISQESLVYRSVRAPLTARLKYDMYRIGYGIMRNGAAV